MCNNTNYTIIVMKKFINNFINKFKRPFYEWSEWQSILIGVILGVILVFLTEPIRSCNTNNTNNTSTRNYAYEHYCDSIYNANPDYYLDVIMETDEYIDYVNEHGEWWNE